MATRDLSAEDLGRVNWRGTALPYFRKQGGYFTSKELGELLRSSIYMIITTPIGTRPWRPEFGSYIPSLVFEPNDDVLAAQVRAYTVEAIERWENRVRIINVNVDIRDNTMQIELAYIILASGEQVQQFINISRENPLEIVR